MHSHETYAFVISLDHHAVITRPFRAADEIGKYCKANIAWSGKEGKFTDIAPVADWKISKESKYVVFCANETIQGVEFKEDPKLDGKTLIADVSSNFLSRPIDVSKYGVSCRQSPLGIWLVALLARAIPLLTPLPGELTPTEEKIILLELVRVHMKRVAQTLKPMHLYSRCCDSGAVT
eukprot:1177292-Prorocentrum_minimum.AAC.2